MTCPEAHANVDDPRVAIETHVRSYLTPAT